MDKLNKKITIFLSLVCVLLAFPIYKIISSGSMSENSGYVFIIMWIPAVSAFITKLVCDKSLKGLGLNLGKFKYIAIGYLIPLIGGLIVYSIVWITGIGGIDFDALNSFGISGIIGSAIFGIFLSGLSAVGEEIGWRGFLVPVLFKKYSYTKTSIILGVIWSIYHYPLLIFSDYNNGVSLISSLIFFTISVFAICFIASWLRLKSGSVWSSVILHASHNLFIGSILDKITLDKGYTKIFTTEFGVGLSICYVLIAIYFWKKREELSQNTL